ncbi:MAG: redoxin family protein [Gemmatimonadaceae bacterium]
MRAPVLLVVAALVVATTGCDRRPINATAALPAPGAALPAFEFPRAGAPGSVTSASLAGAPAVVALWSTHCPYQGPWVTAFDSLARTYRPRGVRVVVLADDAPGAALDSALARAAWRSAVSEVGVAEGQLAELFDRSRTASERAADRVEFVLPSFLLVGPDGRVVRRAWGPVTGFDAALDSLLARTSAIAPPEPPPEVNRRGEESVARLPGLPPHLSLAQASRYGDSSTGADGARGKTSRYGESR